MPISDYAFQDGIFFARETGQITPEDATDWASRLALHAAHHPTPIVALVDAMEIAMISGGAVRIFEKATFTPNLLAVVVATNAPASVTSRGIGILGKRGGTIVHKSVEDARLTAEKLIRDSKKD